MEKPYPDKPKRGKYNQTDAEMPLSLRVPVIEPGSTLTVIALLSAITMITAAVVIFMSPMAAVHRNEKGKTTAGHDQQNTYKH